VTAVGTVHLASDSWIHTGRASCIPVAPLTITAGGNVVIDPGSSSNTGVVGGDSVADAGCAAQQGGSVTLRAGGTVDAGHVDAGDGSPPGVLTIEEHAAVDAGVPRISFVEQGLAVSRTYDLGTPASVSSVHLVPLATVVADGVQHPLEIALADAPDGPFANWTSTPASLGAHRYLRWRIVLDRAFFTSLGLDSLRIDLHR